MGPTYYLGHSRGDTDLWRMEYDSFHTSSVIAGRSSADWRERNIDDGAGCNPKAVFVLFSMTPADWQWEGANLDITLRFDSFKVTGRVHSISYPIFHLFDGNIRLLNQGGRENV